MDKSESDYKQTMPYQLNIHILISVSVIFFPEDVHAYLDPGTGSYALQVVLAMVVGGLYSLKLYWTTIKAFLKRIFSIGKNHNRD